MRNTMEILSGADSTAGRIKEEEYTGVDHGGGEKDGSMLSLDQAGILLIVLGGGRGGSLFLVW